MTSDVTFPKPVRLFGTTSSSVRLAVLLGAFLLAMPAMSKTSAEEKHKQAEAHAKVVEARALEQQGKLREAAARLSEARTIYELKEIHSDSKRINQKIVDSLVSKAAADYQAGRYSEVVTRLKDAESIQPLSPRTLQNLAAAYYKLGDRKSALEYLDKCKGALGPDSAEIPRIEQYRTLVLTGETGAELSADSKASVTTVNAALRVKPPHGEEIPDYSKLEADQEASKCKALEANEPKLPRSGAVFFNLAKCAREEGRLEDANRYFASYLQVAPNTLDGSEVDFNLKDLAPLLDLKDPKAGEVRKYHSDAYRLILARKYGPAAEAYLKAEQLLPAYPLTSYKLGMLYAGSGDVQKATQYLRRYLDLETNPEARRVATELLETLPAHRSEYNSHLEQAKTLLAAQKLQEAVAELQKSFALFPFAPEVNTLLAYAYLNGNNAEQARHALDAAWSQGYPVFFYATIPVWKNTYRAAKVEIEPETLRIIFLDSPPPMPEGKTTRKERQQAANQPHVRTPAGVAGDKFANLAGSSRDILPAESADILTIPVTQLKHVSTSANTVEIGLPADYPGLQAALGSQLHGSMLKAVASAGMVKGGTAYIHLVPQVSGFTPPAQAWPARKFANTYTRMFSQYLGYDGVKLGPEHLSAGEKWLIAAEIGMVAMGGVQALNNISQSFMAVYIGVQAFGIVQQAILSQRMLAQSLDFKVISPEPMHLDYRTDEFK